MSGWAWGVGVLSRGLTSLFFFPKRKMNTSEFPIRGILLVFCSVSSGIFKNMQSAFVIMIFI